MPTSFSCGNPQCGKLWKADDVAPANGELRCPYCHEVQPPQGENETRDFESDSRDVKADVTQTFVGAKNTSEGTAAGARVGRFVIRRKLGEGAFGNVYEAHDPQLDRAVALKVAKLDSGDASGRIQRFLREAKAAANLRHPHIVPLYEYGQDGERFYIASAFIHGKTLHDDLVARKEQPPDLKRAARIIRQMAEALGYAHAQGIVHRDLKPANTMLDANDQPLVMDFGLATRQDEAEKLTHAGQVLGTPRYMSPEQAKGDSASALPASDQYSLGVMLYEMITGVALFKGTAERVIFHHIETEPTSPRKLNAAISRDLETICLKCLEKDPAKRYADCQALAEDLRRWQDGEPTKARPIGVFERAKKWCARHPLAAALVSALAVTLVVGTTIAIFAMRAREDARTRRDIADALDLRNKFDQQFQNADQRPDLALVGIAKLLPAAVRLRDRSLAETMRLHVGGWSRLPVRLEAIWAHEDEVVAVALSADGKTALTGSHDKTARLWNTATGKAIGPELRHQDKVVAVALSADGTIALTASHDKTPRLWNGQTGLPMGRPLQHRDQAIVVGLNADGRKALSADGNFAITCSKDRTALFWAKGREIGSMEHRGEVIAVALSPDGTMAVTGSADKTAQLWKVSVDKPSNVPIGLITPSPIGQTLQHNGSILAVALSADGKTVLTGSSDKTARLWKVAAVRPQLQHESDVVSVVLSANGQTALTGEANGAARLWQTATGKPIGLPLQYQRVQGLSADGTKALTSSIATGHLWNAATGTPLDTKLDFKDKFDPRLDPVRAGVLSADATMAVTVRWRTQFVQAWDASGGKPLGSLQLVRGEVDPPFWMEWRRGATDIALSADGKIGLVGGPGMSTRLWEPATGKVIGRPIESVTAVAMSADGKVAFTGTHEKTAQLWEAATGNPIGQPMLHQGGVTAIALSSDGAKALSGSTDKMARLWDGRTGNQIGQPLKHLEPVASVALSADGKTALTGSLDKTARFWDVETGKPIGPALEHRGWADNVWQKGPIIAVTVALSADGKTALTGSYALSSDGITDKTARIWKVPQPIRGDPERIMLWTQVITGLEVDELMAVRVLDAATWQQRRQRLQELGGPPQID